MFKMAICDDNVVNLDYEYDLATKCVSQYTDKYQCDKYNSGVELVSDIKKMTSYDLILLDWEMDQMNGLETAKVIRDQSEKVIIAFVTNYAVFAPEGYKVDADRFVIKNEAIFEQQFCECIEFAYKKSLSANKYITDFIEGTVKINTRDIVCIKSNNHYLYYSVYGLSKEKQLTQRAKMESILKDLDDNMVQVHRNFVVNLRYIERISNQWITLNCGGYKKQVPIRRGFEKEVEQIFYKFLGKIND